MSHFRPHIAIEHLLVYAFRGHMHKLGPNSQQMSKILGFQNVGKLRFRFTPIQKNHNLPNFEGKGLIFYSQA